MGTQLRRSKRPVVGLLIDAICDEFQASLVAELEAEARVQGATLLAFVGGPPDPEAGSLASRVYEFVDAARLDALIVSTATLESRAGHDKVVAFAQRFAALPQVSLGSPLPDASNVLLDNAASVRAQVKHLMEAHGCRRLAFVTGPREATEAGARWLGYSQALREAGLALDPELRLEGDFTFESGRAAVRTLAERRVDVDALVLANDEMALGALAELEHRGCRVPEEIRVVGFDDILGAASSRPPLSTQHQPLRELARTAVAEAIRAALGDREPRSFVLQAQAVYRRSCGCGSLPEQFAVDTPPRLRHVGAEHALMQKRAGLISAVLAAGAPLLGQRDAELLVDAFVASLRGKSEHPLAMAWQTLIERVAEAPHQLERLQAVVSALRSAALPSLSELGSLATRAETALHECRVLLASAMQQASVRQHMTRRRHLQAVGHLGQALLVVKTPAELVAEASRAALLLGIERGYLSLSSDGRLADGSGELMFVSLACAGAPIPLPDILGSTKTPFALVPIHQGDRWFGLLLIELGKLDSALVELLSGLLGAGLAAMDSLRQEQGRTKLLERLMCQGAHQADRLEVDYGKLVNRLSTVGPGRAADEALAELGAAIQELRRVASEWSEVVKSERETLRLSEPESGNGDPH